MKVHILQHVSFESPGNIVEWATNRGFEISYTCFFNNDSLPKHSDYDFLVVMGGPMGVHDETEYSWLSGEKEFLKEAISLNKKILGVCLGSQLLANVLGSKVYPNAEKEIGFMPVSFNQYAIDKFGLPEQLVVFQWHGDTFDLPVDAVLLSSSEVCVNQAFMMGNTIMALQFHLEVNPEIISNLLIFGKNELIEKPHIQNEEKIVN